MIPEDVESPQPKVFAMRPLSCCFRRNSLCWVLLIHPLAVSSFEDIKENIQIPLDIRAPGSDLANFPDSAFTLPQGGFYLESSPLSYNSKSRTLAPAYNWEYLLRYGLLDWVELRLYSQGFTVQGQPNPAVGFSPLTFDAKIHFWDEWEDYYLPAAALEVTLETDLLGSPAFNVGTDPSFSLNFDQGLPWDLDIEYNLGAARFQNPQDLNHKVWDVTFAWAIQKEVMQDVAVFLNGYYNAANLPRIRKTSYISNPCPLSAGCSAGDTAKLYGIGREAEHAIGVGALWTLNDKVSLFTNLAAGVTSSTPGFIGYMGFAWTP